MTKVYKRKATDFKLEVEKITTEDEIQSVVLKYCRRFDREQGRQNRLSNFGRKIDQ